MNKSKLIVFEHVVRFVLCFSIVLAGSLAGSIERIKSVAAGTAGVHSPDDPRILYQFTPVATGLSQPLFVTHAGDARLFIVEQGGIIKVWKSGSVLDTPFLNITSKVLCCGERGLLGLAFEPNYASTKHFYVYYSDKNADTSGDIVIARYAASSNPDVAETIETRILTIPHRVHGNHNGGWLGFGPDGFLYAGIGDGGSGGDPDCRGQNPQDLLGKMLRLNVVGQITYTTPISNMADAAPEVWAIGLRNPWRNSFDRQSGAFYIADVGQDAWEEVSVAPAYAAGGLNFGWSKREGKHAYDNACTASPIPAREPVAEYSHSEVTAGGAAVTGGYMYRGSSQPWLNGTYFYADSSSGQLWAMTQSQPSVYSSVQITDTNWAIVSFGEDKQGELYIVDIGGTVYRLGSKALLNPAYLPLVTK